MEASYDKMGNILSLKRGGIDDLAYTYNGNQLVKVTDSNETEPTYYGAFHFVDGADVENEYVYDVRKYFCLLYCFFRKSLMTFHKNVVNLLDECQN